MRDIVGMEVLEQAMDSLEIEGFSENFLLYEAQSSFYLVIIPKSKLTVYKTFSPCTP